MRTRAAALAACLALLAAQAVACGGSDAPAPAATRSPGVLVAAASPSVSPRPAQCYANEMGQVLVLEYHTINRSGAAFTRSPEKFRDDLQWLYDHGFFVIPIHDYVTNRIAAPAGKRPAVLTFDDGVVTQFNYLVDVAGKTGIDRDSAVGVMESFFGQHPDFGRGALFSVLPLAPFAWPDSPDQLPYAKEKLRWLLDQGYEIGNHTLGHVDLSSLTTEEAKKELASQVDYVHEYVPAAKVEVIALPFGGYAKDEGVLRGFDYQGRRYEFLGALKVGGNPAASPADPQFDAFAIARIQASDEELAKWFGYVEDNPGLIYVSDGDPDTVAVTKKDHPEWTPGPCKTAG